MTLQLTAATGFKLRDIRRVAIAIDILLPDCCKLPSLSRATVGIRAQHRLDYKNLSSIIRIRRSIEYIVLCIIVTIRTPFSSGTADLLAVGD